MKNPLSRGGLTGFLLLVAVPTALIAFLWATRANEVSALQLLLAFGLIFVPWQAYLNWRREGRPELPLFGMIALMYFLYFGIPLFWGDLTITTNLSPLGQEVPTSAITAALMMAFLGVCSLYIGMKSKIGRMFTPRNLEAVGLRPGRLSYIRLVLVVGSFINFSDGFTNFVGQGGQQAFAILVSTIPLLAFAILFRNYLKGEAKKIDKILILGFLGTRFLSGMSSGWLGVFTSILIICAALYIAERKRIPRFALLVVVAFTLFFQVGKDDFRRVYWRDQAGGAGRLERMQFWIDSSSSKWVEAIDDPTGETIKEALSPSVNRLSLLSQSGNVIDKTPSVVAYQYGQLYSYMFITFVPRFIWPDKPSVNEANQYYQVAYGLTSEENLEGVSIAVGTLTEGYMSFGWWGALGIMFLSGIFFDFFQSTFLSRASGQILSALGVVLLPQFLSIESQLAQYMGGIVQQILFSLIIMLPALSLRRSQVRFMKPALEYGSK
ncbi:MAG TPA: hypothetical protein VJT50_08430 [Pyrinomonadaceae bacterium]|nr:hypothetical protein [Pyrinomonadaceae bacterium]